MMFIAGAAVAGSLHEILRFHVQFPQAVDYDMDMDIAAAVMTVHVRAYQSLMSGKEALGKFQT